MQSDLIYISNISGKKSVPGKNSVVTKIVLSYFLVFYMLNQLTRTDYCLLVQHNIQFDIVTSKGENTGTIMLVLHILHVSVLFHQLTNAILTRANMEELVRI